MGSTPRENRFQVPLATRSTDVSMAEQCFGRWVLTLFNEHRQAEASFFSLGSALHDTIEHTILNDLDADAAQVWLESYIELELDRIEKSGAKRIESSKRGFDTMHDDAKRMLANWFKFVHPHSTKRHPIYAPYNWPPKVEVKFERRFAGLRYPLWGSVDAIFDPIRPLSDPYLIIDWKSGTRKQKSDFQLNFYRLGLGLTYNARAAYHHLDRVQERAVIQEAADYSPQAGEIVDLIHNTENLKVALLDGEYPEFNPSFLCAYCPVQEFCPVGGDYRDSIENDQDLRANLKKAVPLEIVTG